MKWGQEKLVSGVFTEKSGNFCLNEDATHEPVLNLSVGGKDLRKSSSLGAEFHQCGKAGSLFPTLRR
jgi:hypothetical protein